MQPAPRFDFGGTHVTSFPFDGQTKHDPRSSLGKQTKDIPPVKPVPSFSFGGQTKPEPSFSFDEQTKDIPPVKPKYTVDGRK